MADPTGILSLAFDDETLVWEPTWTRIDSTPSLVASVQIDRGRQFELDRTDTGRAVVSISDRDGILDPTNASGPYYGKIEPLVQAVICRWDPVREIWAQRFRGWIDELDYSFDPSQRVNRLELGLVDLFEIVSASQMQIGQFGDTPPDDSADQVFFDNALMDDRVRQILGNCHIPDEFSVVFSGNVTLHETVYSPGESAMDAIQEAADAEFPGVSNVYVDRRGRLAVHGRLAKFDPGSVAAGAGDDAWAWRHWKAGDGAAVDAVSGTAHIRTFAFNRGLAKVINQALATPSRRNAILTPAEMAGQLVSDAVSIGLRGIRSWTATDLLTETGLLDSTDDLTETRRFAEYYVANYAEPRDRITTISFRSMRPTDTHAPVNWLLLCDCDIGDQVDVTVASPGGGGFNAEPYFIEGIHESEAPLGAAYGDVTVTLDLSPAAYFPASGAGNPWNPL